jgi:hypothetical protein
MSMAPQGRAPGGRVGARESTGVEMLLWGAFVSARNEIRLDKRPITSTIVVMLWSWRVPWTHPTVTLN